MAFLGDARAVVQDTLPGIKERTQGYVRRILIREDISYHETAPLRFSRLFEPLSSEEGILTDYQITTLPRVVLIGNAGCGKSYVLQNAYVAAAHSFLSSPNAPLACFVDLFRHLSSRRSIQEALHQRYQGTFARVCSEHEPGSVLFLDALDERVASERNPIDFVNDLLFFFEHHRDQIRTIVLACRRAIWDASWLGDSRSEWCVYHADHLGFAEYNDILPDREDRQEFFRRVDTLGISNLLGLPFIGFDLAHTHKRGEDLPTSRRAWFQERIQRLLQGQRREGRRDPAPPLRTLLKLSEQLACIASIGQVAMWTVQDAVDHLGESDVLRRERLPMGYEDLSALFERPLFSCTDGRFSFSHQLFREFLAAEAVSVLPLRKQGQLLESPNAALRHRVLTAHRGIAGFVSEVSASYRQHLVEHDPLVLFLAEPADLPVEDRERLVGRMVDKAIADHRAHWWEIPPRGDRPGDCLVNYRPHNVAQFARPYLESSDEMTLLWGTACTLAWGGSVQLNDLLIGLAHDSSLNVEIRKNAIDALLASREHVHIRQMYDLLDDEDDQVRGHTLHAYRVTEMPSPADYLTHLHGGAHNRSLLCLLQREVASFGLSLDESGLHEAFEQMSVRFDETGNLRDHVMRGLLERAVELAFGSVPPSLIIRLWLSPGVPHTYYGSLLRQIIAADWDLFTRLWSCAVDWVGQRPTDFSRLDSHLIELCDDRVFSILPQDLGEFTPIQVDFMTGILRGHFLKQPTSERLEEFRGRAAGYAEHWQLPESPHVAAPRDPLQPEPSIAQALLNEDLPAHVRALALLRATASLLSGDESHWVEPAKIVDLLGELSPPLRDKVVQVFSACVSEVQYSRTQSSQAGKYTMTLLRLAVPFLVLWELGAEIPVEKLEQFIRCYGFLEPPPSTAAALWATLLDQLHDLDRQRWDNTVIWLVEFPSASSSGPLQYLIDRASDLYVERCRNRLRECEFHSGSFHSLLDYWMSRKPSDLRQILRACHECAVEEVHKAELLSVLLQEDDDWAWEEVRRLLDRGLSPLSAAQRALVRPLLLPPNPSRLHVMADWLAVSRQQHEDDDFPVNVIAHTLEKTIALIGGEAALEQLRRLRREDAYPGAQWLSYTILQVEDQMLTGTGRPMDSGRLLDFLNHEAMGAVLSERDLFEWVCQAVEDTKARLEGEARQVLGYWNHWGNEWAPKTEPECQNVLWPTIKDALSGLAIVGVEEKSIRANRVDFWVEMPVREESALRVAVELKVARKYYGPARLVAPLQTDLLEKYLRPSGCQHGIYVVLWFKDNERYPYPTGWATCQELVQELEGLRRDVCDRHHVTLACYVVDMTTVARLR